MDRSNVLKLGRAASKSLLDVGAGPLAVIAARDFDCQVITIDISTSALKSARQQAVQAGLADHIEFDRQDAADLPYLDESFDIAVSYGAVHHVPVSRRKKLLAELFRVVRERIIIAEYTTSEFERVHTDGEYEPVDRRWLEETLRRLGRTEIHPGERMNVYICHRGK